MMNKFARIGTVINIDELNLQLQDYDDQIFARLEPVLAEIELKSKALASNLKRCITKIRDTDRYLKAYNGEPVAMKEKDLPENEFMIFREYVRLLRSCTIMCGKDVSEEFKEIFVDFFFGTRVDLAINLR